MESSIGINALELPNVNSHVQAGLNLSYELRDYLLARAQIEKEYGRKLSELGKRLQTGTQIKRSLLSKDSTITKSNFDSSPIQANEREFSDPEGKSQTSKSSDILVKLGLQITEQADLHIEYSDSLASNYSSELKRYTASCEESKKKYTVFSQKVFAEKEKAISEKDKHQQKVLEQLAKKNAVKNEYIISTSMANQVQKQVSQNTIVKIIQNLLQINELRINNTRETLKKVLLDENSFHQKKIEISSNSISELDLIDPSSETSSLVSFLSQKQFPPTAELTVSVDESNGENPYLETDPDSVTILSNRSAKAKSNLNSLMAEREHKVESADEFKSDTNRLLLNEYIELDQSIIINDLAQAKVQAAISCISQAIGDVVLSSPHSFKSHSFKIPTSCDFCNESIWGLSSKGVKCEICGFSCHAKCELKVKSECNSGSGDIQSKNFLTRAFRRKKTKKNSASGIDYDQRSSIENSRSSHYYSSGSNSQEPNGATSGFNCDDINSTNNFDSQNTVSNDNSISSPSSQAKHDTLISDRPQALSSMFNQNQLENSARNLSSNVTDNSRNMDSFGSSGHTSSANNQQATALYDYSSNDDVELIIKAGDALTIIEPDADTGRVGIRKNGEGIRGARSSKLSGIFECRSKNASDEPPAGVSTPRDASSNRA
ncbi:Protein BZZ1 [Smittium culicis]|uniref:Protein BZZ1 n=1 Tax=Smittium culicis TaxID=133412 RepID=A0A1R1YQT7_9FUNG|nr:Protein BZZ1 [Smittium culicis]